MRAFEEITIRPARPDEFSAILHLWARARSVPPRVPDDDGALETSLAGDQEALLVADLTLARGGLLA